MATNDATIQHDACISRPPVVGDVVTAVSETVSNDGVPGLLFLTDWEVAEENYGSVILNLRRGSD